MEGDGLVEGDVAREPDVSFGPEFAQNRCLLLRQVVEATHPGARDNFSGFGRQRGLFVVLGRYIGDEFLKPDRLTLYPVQVVNDPRYKLAALERKRITSLCLKDVLHRAHERESRAVRAL